MVAERLPGDGVGQYQIDTLDGTAGDIRRGAVEKENATRAAVKEARRIADAIEGGRDIAHIGAAVGDGIDRRALQRIVRLRADAEDQRAVYRGQAPCRHDGRYTNTPLLSSENIVTGFGTCWARVT